MTRLGKVLMVLVAAAGVAAALLVGRTTRQEVAPARLTASQIADMQPRKQEEPRPAPRISRPVEEEPGSDGRLETPEDGNGS